MQLQLWRRNTLTAGNLAVSGSPRPETKSDPRRVRTAVGRRMIPNAPTISETQAMPNPKRIMALVFVRLAHDRRFVGEVLFLFVLSSSSGSRGGIVLPMIKKGRQSINLVENSSGMCVVERTARHDVSFIPRVELINRIEDPFPDF
jgi:hypothetical protein